MHPTTSPRSRAAGSRPSTTRRAKQATAAAAPALLEPTDAAMQSAVSALAMLYAGHLGALALKGGGQQALDSTVRLAGEQWSPGARAQLLTRFAAHMLSPRFLAAGVDLSSVMVALRWARDTFGLDMTALDRNDLGTAFLHHGALGSALAERADAGGR